MRRLLSTVLLVTLALQLLPAPLGAQEPEPDAPAAEDRWRSVRDKGLSLLKPVREKTAAEIQHLLADLNERYFPLIKEAGFGVDEIQITVGVPTALTLHLHRLERIDPDRQKELLDRYRDDATAVGILESLFAADRFEIEGFEAAGVHVSLGFPPSATVVLSPRPANS